MKELREWRDLFNLYDSVRTLLVAPHDDLYA
jgi:hypothetical protein